MSAPSTPAAPAAPAPAEVNAQPNKLHGIRRGIFTILLFAAGMWFMHTLDWNPSWGNLFGSVSDLMAATGIILVAIAAIVLILAFLRSKSESLKLIAIVLTVVATMMGRDVVAGSNTRILAVLGVVIVFGGLAYAAIKVDLKAAPRWSVVTGYVARRKIERQARLEKERQATTPTPTPTPRATTRPRAPRPDAQASQSA